MSFNLAGGRRLLLAGSNWGGIWIAAGVAAVVLLLVLFREERKLVSRRVGLGLLTLRLTGGAGAGRGAVRADRGADVSRDGPGRDGRGGCLGEHGDGRPGPAG